MSLSSNTMLRLASLAVALYQRMVTTSLVEVMPASPPWRRRVQKAAMTPGVPEVRGSGSQQPGRGTLAEPQAGSRAAWRRPTRGHWSRSAA